MSRLAMQIGPAGCAMKHLLRPAARSSPRALLARAFGAHGQRLFCLLDQAEAHGFATAIASREPVAFAHQNLVHYAMRVMDNLIDAALGAEFTRKKLISATGAFHKKLPDSCRQKEIGRGEWRQCEVGWPVNGPGCPISGSFAWRAATRM